MLNALKTLPQAVQTFARDEEGAQIIEYALIVAVVSIGLIVALKEVDISGWATKVTETLNFTKP